MPDADTLALSRIKLAELQRQRMEAAAAAKAGPSPEIETELKQLRERLDSLEKQHAQKDAKIAEQADRINRLTERLVREAGMA